jgi:hypothetical protein
MARLLRNLLQDHVSQVTRAKQPHRPAPATAKSSAPFTKVAEPAMATMISMPTATAKAVPMFIVPMSLSTALLFSVKTSKVFEMLM